MTSATSSPSSARTFRVFFSSTFEDLKEERRVIQTDVFPALARACHSRGARFQPVDLRWGIRDQASLDHRTLDICFAEIERCKRTGLNPHFVVLLGDRYGWRPLPPRIEAAEFALIRAHIDDAGNRALVDEWYDQLDENAVPAERVLKRRDGAFTDPHEWEAVETRLREALVAAARAGKVKASDLLKYEASATHQEIARALETSRDDRRGILAFFRAGPRAEDRELTILKDYLRSELPSENVFGFAQGDHTGLCKTMVDSLGNLITVEASRFVSQSERDAHAAFAADRSMHFVGRDVALREIRDYVSDTDRRPLVVWGPSGSGKSAIMAKASEGLDVIRRFIGATHVSSDGASTLQSICREIAERYDNRNEIPTTFDKLTVTFAELIKLATAGQPLIIFLDALDQLGPHDPAAALNWLPSALPPQCRLVLSSTALPPALHQARLLEVQPFSQDEADATLDAWLAPAHRTLRPAQRDHLMAIFLQTRRPLHLKLAFEEARLWRSFDPVSECTLGSDVEGTIDAMFDRLSRHTNHGPTLVDRALGYLTASRDGLTEDEMLSVLTDDEDVWRDVIGEGANRHHDPLVHRLPVVIWSRLYLDLEPYLMQRLVTGATTIGFYHQQLASRAAMRYLAGDIAAKRHLTLAGFFARSPSEYRSRPRTFGYTGVLAFNHRKLSELAYQLTMAESWNDLEALLTDFRFLDAKARSGAIRDLIQDYALATMRRSAAFPDETLPPWIECQRFVNADAHLIERYVGKYPQLFFQQAFNQAKTGRLHEVCENELSRGRGPEAYWFERANRPQQAQVSPCIFTLGEHAGQVYAVAFSRDETTLASAASEPTIYIWNTATGVRLRTLDGHTAAVLHLAWTDDDLLVSASWDGTVRVWSPPSGTCRFVLAGHTAPVASLHLIDDTRCLTAGFDRTVRVWNYRTGAVESVLEGHSRAAVGVDSDTIVGAAEDGSIRVWTLKRPAHVRTLRPHVSALTRLTCLATLRSGRIAAGYRSGHIEVWNPDNTARDVVLAGHKGPIAGIVEDEHGRFWSWSFDYTVRRWSSAGRLERTSSDHDSAVTHGAIVGKWLFTGSQDSTIRLWELVTGECKAVLRGHRSWITALAAGENHYVASGGWDRAVRIWDIRTALTAPPEDLTAIVPEIAQSHRLVHAVVTDPTRAISVANGPHQAHVWDLERGECTRIVHGEASPEYKEALAVLKRSNHTGWSYCGEDPMNRWGLLITGVTEERSGRVAQGIGCTQARAVEGPRSPGVILTESYPVARAFYPLEARPYASVYESDRTIAFDTRNREAHILRLHAPRVDQDGRD